MIIATKDPFPGRCLCHRQQPDADGYPQMLRCLDQEGHTGGCRFPSPPERRGSSYASNIQSNLGNYQ